jgi:hypothetical protein
VKTFEGLMHHITGPRVPDERFIAFMREAADRHLTLRQYTWQRVLVLFKNRQQVCSTTVQERS